MALVGRIISIFILLSIFDLNFFNLPGYRGVANLVDCGLTGRALILRVLHPFYDAGPTELVSTVVEFGKVLWFYEIHADHAASC
jgi:hypothetical protein